MAESPELLACARANPPVAAQLRKLLLELFLAGHHRISTAFTKTHVQPGFVRRACEFMEANWKAPLELVDIANASEVSSEPCCTPSGNSATRRRCSI